MKIIGMIVMFVILILVIGAERILIFIDPFSLSIVAGLTMCGLFYSYGVKMFTLITDGFFFSKKATF